MITKRIKRQLHALDWDFAEHLPGTSKAIHWYPGTFPSELPATLIQAMSRPNDLVFDPYGGIGTTGLEALRQGRRAWVVDSNPIGSLVSYVSGCLIILKGINSALPSIILENLRSHLSAASERSSEVGRLLIDDHLSKEIDKKLKGLVTPSPEVFSKSFDRTPNIDDLSKWIESRTIQNIEKIRNSLANASLGHFGRLLGLVMLSAILRPASSQTQSWGHIADNVWPKQFDQKDPFRLSQQWLSRTETIVKKTAVTDIVSDDLEGKRFWVSLHNWQGTRRPRTAPNVAVDALITSPPYAGAIDYALSQRLSLYFFGYSEEDVKKFCSGEIGARRKRFLATSQVQWGDDLVSALSRHVGYLAQDALLAFVLPHKDHGRELGPAAIEKYLQEQEFSKIVEVERSIRQLRARQSWTSIKKEIVQIYGQ